ncbi:MAG: hypothetical protein WC798_02380 [Candidatus Paceibacterota bacterium]
MSTVVWFVVIIGLVLLGIWYFMPRPASANPVLTVANDATLGDFLVASNGMTLYLYTNDTKDVTNCYDLCAVNWPPYVRTTAEPLVGGAGMAGTIATTARTDGTEQITYNGIPLYFWKNDLKPGDTTGQNVGGVWFVVHP